MSGPGSLLYGSLLHFVEMRFLKFQLYLCVLGCTACAMVQGDFMHCLRFICCVDGGQKQAKAASPEEPEEISNTFVF